MRKNRALFNAKCSFYFSLRKRYTISTNISSLKRPNHCCLYRIYFCSKFISLHKTTNVKFKKINRYLFITLHTLVTVHFNINYTFLYLNFKYKYKYSVHLITVYKLHIPFLFISSIYTFNLLFLA